MTATNNNNNNIDDDNIFDEFVKDSDLSDEINAIKNNQKKDLYFYIEKA
jgi:hypothetical protein